MLPQGEGWLIMLFLLIMWKIEVVHLKVLKHVYVYSYNIIYCVLWPATEDNLLGEKYPKIIE